MFLSEARKYEVFLSGARKYEVFLGKSSDLTRYSTPRVGAQALSVATTQDRLRLGVILLFSYNSGKR